MPDSSLPRDGSLVNQFGLGLLILIFGSLGVLALVGAVLMVIGSHLDDKANLG